MTPLPNNSVEGICVSSQNMDDHMHDCSKSSGVNRVDLSLEQDRLKTLLKCSTSIANMQRLAADGFYFVNYANKGDKLKCYYCNIEIPIRDGIDPLELHRLNPKTCKFIEQQVRVRHPEYSSPPSTSAYDACGSDRRPSISKMRCKPKDDDGLNTTDTPRFPHFSSKNERLQTFENWSPELANDLSDAGFFYANQGTEIVCFHCGGGISWEGFKRDPFEEHYRAFENCHFIKMYRKGCEDKKAEYILHRTRWSNYSDRLKSFDNWPVPFIDKQELAAAGFYYFNREDRVRCFCCNIEIGNWEENDVPILEHRRHSKNCSFLMENDVNAETSSGGVVNGYDTCGPYDLPNRKRARYPQFESYSSRLYSFRKGSWQAESKISALCEAGFFYTGDGDCTICYHCGIGLKDWKEQDDPWVQHASWSNECQYVIDQKGSAFVHEAQEKTHETMKLSKEEIKSAVGALQDMINVLNPPDVNIGNVNENNGYANTENATGAESERTDEESELLCKICFARRWNNFFYPCGHTACTNCASNLRKCAFCRKPILERVQAYRS